MTKRLNVKTKIFSYGHFYFIGCFSADKIVVAGNSKVTYGINVYVSSMIMLSEIIKNKRHNPMRCAVYFLANVLLEF